MSSSQNESLTELYEELCTLRKSERELMIEEQTEFVDGIHGKDLTDTIQNLQDKLLKISTEKANQQLKIERLQISDTLNKTIDEDNRTKDKEDVLELLESNGRLSCKILSIHEETLKRKKEIIELQTQENNIATENKCLIRDLESIKTNSDERNKLIESDLTRRLRAKLKNHQDKCVIMKHILRFIVLGAEIDWIKQLDLKELFLNWSDNNEIVAP